MDIRELLELAQLEETYARELEKLAQSIKHPALRALLESIAKDSEKHALMYKAMTELIIKTQPFISEKEYGEIAEVMGKHIETEMKMLEKAKDILSSSGDPRIKLLVSAIVDDETRHHKLLLSIKGNIAEAETLTEELLWQMIWKESPWHGAPGG
ncbi:MAG: ferritin-like domain-containing protein [Desulfurococcaceae archaeon]